MNPIFQRRRIKRVRARPARVSPLFINKILKAYRPLYQRGLLMDGLYRWPPTGNPEDPSTPVLRQRTWLVALAWSRALFLFHRDKS